MVSRTKGEQQSASKIGIKDWGRKLAILKNLYGFSLSDIAHGVMGRSNFHEAEKVKDSMRKWSAFKPIGSGGSLFLHELALKLIEKRPDLKGREATIKTIFVTGTIDKFIELLDEQTQNLCKSEPTKDNGKFHRPWIPRQRIQESILKAFEDGRIDQKTHYLTPEAEENWRAVVDTGVYTQYGECKAALLSICETDAIWRKFFQEDGGDGAVMLGCGAGTKDSLVIRSMLSLSSRNKLHYALVDFSNFMLQAAFRQVDWMLMHERFSDRVELSTHEFDFVNNFSGVGSTVSRPDKNVAWLLPGGTLGNLNEQIFFESLKNESKKDDIVVIGAECVSSVDVVDIERLKRKYDTPAVRHFVEMPFRALLHAMRIDKFPEIFVHVVDGKESGHSQIQGAKTVEIYSKVCGKKIVLLTSTRFNEDALVEFADQRHFKKESIVSSPSNERYKQFVFRRT